MAGALIIEGPACRLTEVITELDVRATELFPSVIDRLRDGPWDISQ